MHGSSYLLIPYVIDFVFENLLQRRSQSPVHDSFAEFRKHKHKD